MHNFAVELELPESARSPAQGAGIGCHGRRCAEVRTSSLPQQAQSSRPTPGGFQLRAVKSRSPQGQRLSETSEIVNYGLYARAERGCRQGAARFEQVSGRVCVGEWMRSCCMDMTCFRSFGCHINLLLQCIHNHNLRYSRDFII